MNSLCNAPMPAFMVHSPPSHETMRTLPARHCIDPACVYLCTPARACACLYMRKPVHACVHTCVPGVCWRTPSHWGTHRLGEWGVLSKQVPSSANRW